MHVLAISINTMNITTTKEVNDGTDEATSALLLSHQCKHIILSLQFPSEEANKLSRQELVLKKLLF